jgi:hypothetical protein
VLYTDFDAEECRRRLLHSIDPDKFRILSRSGGPRPVIGRIEDRKFRLRKRQYWQHNYYAPQFYGNLLPKQRGTIIEGYFDIRRWPRILTRIWIAGVILLAAVTVVLYLRDVLWGTTSVQVSLGLLVLPGLVVWGVLLPKLGLWLSRDEEQFILEFLQRTLVANQQPNFAEVRREVKS